MASIATCQDWPLGRRWQLQIQHARLQVYPMDHQASSMSVSSHTIRGSCCSSMRHHKIAFHSERTWIHFPCVASQGRSNHGTSSHESGELRLLDLHLQLRKDSTGSACLFHSRMKVHGGRPQARALQLSSSPYGLKRHRGRFVQTQIHLRSIHSENLQTWQASRAPPTNTTDCVRLQPMDVFDRHDLKAANCKKGKGSLQLVFHCDC